VSRSVHTRPRHLRAARRVRYGTGLRTASYAQSSADDLPAGATAADAVMQMGVDDEEARGLLGRLNLGGDSGDKPVEAFSGGERRRVARLALPHDTVVTRWLPPTQPVVCLSRAGGAHARARRRATRGQLAGGTRARAATCACLWGWLWRRPQTGYSSWGCLFRFLARGRAWAETAGHDD